MFFSRNTRNKYFFYFIILFFVLSFQHDVSASTSAGYVVSDIHMRANLNDDGSIDIHEFITYRVSPEFDGRIEKYINISRASEISSLEISAISRNNPDEPLIETEMLPFSYVESPIEGQSGVYTSELVETGGNQFKVVTVFLPDGYENVTISLRYSLSDMIYLYNDTSLLQWQFVPQTESDIAGSISIEIIISQHVFYGNIDAFAHGSENIDNAVIDGSTVMISSDGLKQGEFLEAFVLMPVNAVPYGRKFVDNYILSDMLEFKEHLAYIARQAELKLEQRNRTVMIAGAILLITGLGLGTYFYAHSLKKPSMAEISDEQSSEIEAQNVLPEHYYTPAELSVLVNRSRITPNDMIATLMDMVVKGNLLLTAETSNEDKTLRLKLNEDCHIGRLEPHEEYLINWMLKDIGTGTGFSTLDIKSVLSNPSLKGRFLSKFDTWTRIVIKQAARWNFEQKLSGKPSKLTPFGLTHYAQWKAFKKFLKNYTGEGVKLPLSDWERYMVFAIPLGEAEHLASRLLTLYPEDSFGDNSLSLLKHENFELFDLWFDCIAQGNDSFAS